MIEMYHDSFETENSNEITFVKRAGSALGAGALAVLAVGAIGLYAYVGGNKINTSEQGTYIEAQTEDTQDSTAAAYEKSVTQAAVTMQKAGIDEYDLVVETVKATEKSKQTSETTTTASAKKESKKSETTSVNKKKKKTTTTKKAAKTETTKAAETTSLTDVTSETLSASVMESIIFQVEETDAPKSYLTVDTSETTTTTEAPIPSPSFPGENDDDEKTETKETADKNDSKTEDTSSVAADTSKENEDDVKVCAAMIMYTAEKMNVRTAPSLDSDVLQVLDEGTEVIVTGYTDDWYRFKVDGQTVYGLKKYLTSDMPETAETSVIDYDDTDFDMLCYVLQGEVGNCSEESKIAVANVIINRVKDSRFPNTISEVLTQPNQFTAVYGYYTKTTTPSQNTIDCAKRALAGEDNSNGAVYYYAPKYVGGSTASWFESLEFCAELEGQRFFK